MSRRRQISLARLLSPWGGKHKPGDTVALTAVGSTAASLRLGSAHLCPVSITSVKSAPHVLKNLTLLL